MSTSDADALTCRGWRFVPVGSAAAGDTMDRLPLGGVQFPRSYREDEVMLGSVLNSWFQSVLRGLYDDYILEQEAPVRAALEQMLAHNRSGDATARRILVTFGRDAAGGIGSVDFALPAGEFT